MGLHILKQAIEVKPDYKPSDAEVNGLANLAGRCLESSESGVRMDAVQLCVALHARLGEQNFWEVMKTVGEKGTGLADGPRSLITYYVEKRRREGSA